MSDTARQRAESAIERWRNGGLVIMGDGQPSVIVPDSDEVEALARELILALDRVDKLEAANRAALNLLHGCDYEEGSRIGRAVGALEAGGVST